MPCCPTCACIGEPFECLAVVAPDHYRHFRQWCESGNAAQKMLVRDRSRMGFTPPAPQGSTGSPASSPGGPSLARKAANFGKAIVTHAIAGLPKADDATAESRLEICKTCDSFDADRVACKSCGCNLNVKIYWSEQKCPLGKW